MIDRAIPRWPDRASAWLPVVLGAATVLTMGAMFCYPGGTALDTTTAHYDLFRNFLSDLGMTRAYNGASNRLGAALFAGATLVMSAALATAVLAWLRLYAMLGSASQRRAAHAASIVGLVGCLAFVAVGFTPEDKLMAWHVRATLLGFTTIPGLAFLLAYASRGTSASQHAASTTWASLGVGLATYALLLHAGPPADSEPRLIMYVVLQKVVSIGTMIVLLVQASRTPLRVKIGAG